MLAYVLALVVGLGSFALYMAAFFFPEVHRKNDFIWSGVGLFYALVLWVCAGRITGGVLLGQTASVALLGWLGWQTLALRRQVAPLEQQTALPTSESVKATLTDLSSPETLSQVPSQLGRQVDRVQTWVRALLETTQPKRQPAKPDEAYVPLTPSDFASAGREAASDAPAATPVISTEAVEVSDAVLDEPKPPSTQPPPTRVPAPAPTPIAPKPVASTNPAPATSSARSGGILGQLQTLLKGSPKPDKPVYVRKQYRSAAAAPEVAEADSAPEDSTPDSIVDTPSVAPPEVAPATATPATAIVEEVIEDSLMPADSLLQDELDYEASKHPTGDASVADAPMVEVAPETEHPPVAIPPHPPAPELVEAAIADAEEKHLPADPPATDAGDAGNISDPASE